ncbi:1-deoxy-D-xylulose 5-phosphate reductoisomerase [Marinitoga hydrogenitolerans DSM 16785]|uniref:1-deoxy-D-xylulose 5-phosphate reductoisomerase n=1 Tax=Marinitoga hydrogenitolerans (strain DSM 16785 / JCM 12826 / AT1271) TaxID=1122195 RepID=A0A1M4ZTX7_MARH1|nr:1-deoxy-D-xylulose-5-phosphate reductoisomerase [Marinitoga hydrogenitolerans]SHF21458.1 1-deoxy-D-xylulose 5-phosphate reductoisomerase [Marinitoga hydrogenitolerans DSM 16785]
MKIAITGVTGSIGTQTLDVLRFLKKKNFNFELVGISAGKNKNRLIEIIKEFSPKYASLEFGEIEKFNETQIFIGKDSTIKMLEKADPDFVLVATGGSVGIKHTLKAIEIAKRIGLANKESIVCGGDMLFEYAKKYNTEIIPVDSEHSALFQLEKGDVKPSKIIITASGGALRDWPLNKLNNVTVKDVLNHPVWSMGKRITIDSATMVNKGLEVIEAYYLFNLKKENINVLINRNSHIHAIIGYPDGVMKFHYGIPDMKNPIAYSITYPDRLYEYKYPDLILEPIIFEKIDYNRYPSLKLAFDILGNQKLQIVYNAADEISVQMFLNGEIRYTEIYKSIYQAIEYFDKKRIQINNFDDIISLDNKVKEYLINLYTL